MTAASIPAGFALATPADWFVFDLDALQEEADIARFLDEQAASVPGVAERRDELLALLVGAGRKAFDAGVQFAAALATIREDGVPIIASASVAILDREAEQAALAEELASGPPPAPAAASGTNGSGTERTVGLQIPAGHAARFERVHEVALFADTQLLTFTVQYLLEVPGSGSDLLAITFASPAIVYKDELSELFANVAGTFEWTYEGP